MSLDLKPIRTKADHAAALAEIERLWGAPSGTAEGDQLDVLATVVDAYEATRFPVDSPDPIEAIRFRMEQQSMSTSDLEPLLGGRTKTAEVMSGKRSLSQDMIRRVRAALEARGGVELKLIE